MSKTDLEINITMVKGVTSALRQKNIDYIDSITAIMRDMRETLRVSTQPPVKLWKDQENKVKSTLKKMGEINTYSAKAQLILAALKKTETMPKTMNSLLDIMETINLPEPDTNE